MSECAAVQYQIGGLRQTLVELCVLCVRLRSVLLFASSASGCVGVQKKYVCTGEHTVDGGATTAKRIPFYGIISVLFVVC